jgi:hypothetical protein
MFYTFVAVYAKVARKDEGGFHMAVVADISKKSEAKTKGFNKLFPTKEQLDTRLANAMRVPVSNCMTKQQLLERLSK